MQMSERLDDAEGSSESKSEMNKKRDAELAKLRKLLEDVHLESEENAHQMRTKHQAAVAEMQDQVDQLQKQKSKWVFESSNNRWFVDGFGCCFARNGQPGNKRSIAQTVD